MEPDLDLQKKQIICQNVLHWLNIHFWRIPEWWFQIWRLFIWKLRLKRHLNTAFLFPSSIFCIMTNPMALTSKTEIAFANFSLKLPKWDNFGPKFKYFLFSPKTLEFGWCENANFKYSNCFSNLQFKSIFGPEFNIFVLQKFLLYGKVVGDDFKNDKSFPKFQLKNTQIKCFWS